MPRSAKALIVQKYGGTSVGDIERIRNVARRAMAAKKAGNDVVVVVSAMAGETNRLLKLTSALAKRPSQREQDVVVSTGEQVSVGLLALAIQELRAEMLQLASLGAEVLQIRSGEVAMRYKVPLWVKSSFNDAAGPLVCEEGQRLEDGVVSGIALARDEARFVVRAVPDKPGVAAKI